VACEKPVGAESILLSGLESPGSLVFDGTWLTFANEGTRELLRVGLDGGVPRVIASGQQQISAMTLGPAGLYWAGALGLEGMDLDGGAPVVLVADAGQRVEAIVVVGGAIIWSGDDVRIVPSSGGPARQLSPFGGPIALEGRSVYWADANGALVHFDGTELTTLGKADLDPTCIAVDQTWVYWGTFWGAIYRVPRAGGQQETVVTGEAHIVSLALDGATVYWSAASERSGTIRRKRAGQRPELFIAGDLLPQSLIVTESGLVWLDQTAGTLLRAPR
jgi:hypothetical protein